MTVYNHLLFSEIFFQQVRRETADLDNLRATLSTIRDTWQYYMPAPLGWDGPAWVPAKPLPPDDESQLRDHVVESIFAYLELTYGPCEADERAFFLYADWARQDRTALCLVADIVPCRIARLIDFIVYRLYGLTEEEVAIVEENRP